MKNIFPQQPARHLDDIIFENRNKEYGAYALRNEESAILKKSLFLGIAFFAAMAATPLVINLLNGSEMPAATSDGGYVFVPVQDFPEKPQPEIQKPVTRNPVATFSSTVVTPKRNVTTETPGPTKHDYSVAVPGFTNSDGADPNVTVAPAPPAVVPSPPVAVSPPVTVSDPNEIVKNVDVKADFSGGLEKFRALVGRNMDISEFEGSGERITANVSFIVEKDGSISAIKATGIDAVFNREAEKAVKSVKGKWNAAKVKGVAVRSYFNIPVTVQFE